MDRKPSDGSGYSLLQKPKRHQIHEDYSGRPRHWSTLGKTWDNRPLLYVSPTRSRVVHGSIVLLASWNDGQAKNDFCRKCSFVDQILGDDQWIPVLIDIATDQPRITDFGLANTFTAGSAQTALDGEDCLCSGG